jgi:hypothetical protein
MTNLKLKIKNEKSVKPTAEKSGRVLACIPANSLPMDR